jgi:hypothetical protein
MTQAFTDLPAHLTQLMTSAISGFNEAFSSAVMAHTTSGVEYRRGITNAVGGQFRSLGAKGLDSALQMGEGGLMSKLGFGKSKPTGTQSDPLFVRLIAAAGAAGGTLDSTGAGSLLLSALGASGPAGTTGSSKGSFLSTVLPALTQMIPHRASGGPIPANTPAIVGENGPELFMSSRAGHIVPNSALGGALSKVLPALTHMIPGFASGGPIPSNMPAIVGENGPELFMPASSGRIVPNGDFGGGAGGGDTHVHVDARGAHDPTATEAAVHRAMKSYLPHLDARTIATVRAYNKARPGTARL